MSRRPPQAGPSPVGRPAWLAGLGLLLVALIAAGVLAAGHFGARTPGCGLRSACRLLESTVWGHVPGTRWPVSFLGVAYFAALLATWIVNGRRISRRALTVIRAGGAMSLLFLTAMLA